MLVVTVTLHVRFLIQLGWYRPISGRKMDFGPTRELGEKWPKNGISCLDMGQKKGFSTDLPFFGHFSPMSPVGPKSIFRPFFSSFGPEAQYGSIPAQRDCNVRSGQTEQELLVRNTLAPPKMVLDDFRGVPGANATLGNI